MFGTERTFADPETRASQPQPDDFDPYNQWKDEVFYARTLRDLADQAGPYFHDANGVCSVGHQSGKNWVEVSQDEMQNLKHTLTARKQEYVKGTVAAHRAELAEYGRRHKLQGLDGRLLRGLDPAGMLAVNDTAEIIKAKLDSATYDTLVTLTNELHVGGIWQYADRLKEATDEAVQAWYVLSIACLEVNDRELTPDEYITNFHLVKQSLNTISTEDAIATTQRRASRSFTIEQRQGAEIPIGETDEAFLHMAIMGYKAGVVKQGDLYFVGAHKLDFDAFAREQGLTPTQRVDHGKQATIYQRDGQDVMKKLYDGFAIVFGDKELAFGLTQKAIK